MSPNHSGTENGNYHFSEDVELEVAEYWIAPLPHNLLINASPTSSPNYARCHLLPKLNDLLEVKSFINDRKPTTATSICSVNRVIFI